MEVKSNIIKNKNIMLCLDGLGIGGVETAVINQSLAFKESGFNVYILSKRGIYTDILNSRGITCIDYDYNIDENYLDIKKINEVKEMLEKFNIGQVHIHKFECILRVIPACMMLNIPYVAYLHTGIKGTYDWYMGLQAGFFFELLKIYFEKANKFVAITDMAKSEHQGIFKAPDEKYVVLRNSINFDDIKDEKRTIVPIKKFLIVSRFSNEKLVSIMNAIDIYEEYNKKYNDSSLVIVGDGDIYEKIEERVKNIPNVKMLGKRNDVLDIMDRIDVVMATDRCILEALAKKRIALISGYEGIRGIVTPDNIKNVAMENFAGRCLKEITVSETIEKLEEINNLDKLKLDEMLEKNYEYVYENLNSKKNIFYLTEYTNNYNFNLNDYISLLGMAEKGIQKEENKALKTFNDSQDSIQFFLSQIDRKDEVIVEQSKQIEELKNKINLDEQFKNESLNTKIKRKLSGIKHRINK